MEPRTLNYIAEACEGRVIWGDPAQVVSGICIDSRQVRPGECFFAIRGSSNDGHKFVAEALQRGATAAVVEPGRAQIQPGLRATLIEVQDTRRALAALARRYRMDFNPVVIGVAGSNGKTTVKELLGQVIGACMKAVWSPASYNNEIGVPLTVLQLSNEHKVLVVELGTNHPGELAPLIEIVKPEIGILTSIGREHLEFFGSIEGVLEEERQLAALLPAEGVLVINGDDQFCRRAISETRAKVITVGFDASCQWRAVQTRLLRGGIKFEVQAPSPDYCGVYEVPLIGKHQAVNVLLVLAVCAELGLPPKRVRAALIRCKSAPMRMELQEIGGVRVINDAYNANPDSMVAALRALSGLPGRGRRIAVLGEMAELGDQSPILHREVGKEAAKLQIDQLITVGSLAKFIAEGARTNGLGRTMEFETPEDAVRALLSIAQPGDVILIKASRRAKFERIVEGLRQAMWDKQKCCTI